MKNQYKSSRIKNHRITKKIFLDGVPLKATLRNLLSFFRFGARNKKKYCENIQ